MPRAAHLLIAILSVLAPLAATDPAPAHAQSRSDGCAEALAADAIRWDGIPMEHFTWEGATIDLEPIAGAWVTVCVAGGPLERLPITNAIGCVLVDGKLAPVEDKVACGPFGWIEREGDDLLLWGARSSAATVSVARFRWNGHAFDQTDLYLACGDDPSLPIEADEDCVRE